jgi:thioredoxin 1
MADAVPNLTDATWEAEVVRSPLPVLVDFWAEWCVPCKALAKTVEAVAAELGGRLRVGAMNVEDNPDVPFRYNVRTVPTILVLKGGRVLEQRVGLLSKESLVKLLEPHLA